MFISTCGKNINFRAIRIWVRWILRFIYNKTADPQAYHFIRRTIFSMQINRILIHWIKFLNGSNPFTSSDWSNDSTIALNAGMYLKSGGKGNTQKTAPQNEYNWYFSVLLPKNIYSMWSQKLYELIHSPDV